MTKQELIQICLTLPDTYEDYPFESFSGGLSWAVIRHKGSRKGFAHIYEESDGLPIINIKLPPYEGDLLRQGFCDIKPAYHMNKEHWSGLNPNGNIPTELMIDLITKSYDLTKPKVISRTK